MPHAPRLFSLSAHARALVGAALKPAPTPIAMQKQITHGFASAYLLYSASINPCLSNFSTILGCMNCTGLAFRASGRLDLSRIVWILLAVGYGFSAISLT